jgi:hypothetical protein
VKIQTLAIGILKRQSFADFLHQSTLLVFMKIPPKLRALEGK